MRCACEWNSLPADLGRVDISAVPDSVVLASGISVHILPEGVALFSGMSEPVVGRGTVFVEIASQLATLGYSAPSDQGARAFASWSFAAGQLAAQGVVRYQPEAPSLLNETALHVKVRAFGGCDKAALEMALLAAGFNVVATDEAASAAGADGVLRLLATGSLQDRDLLLYARAAEMSGQYLVPIRFSADTIYVGPLVGPDSNCWDCFVARVEQCRVLERYAERTAILGASARKAAPAGWEWAAAWLLRKTMGPLPTPAERGTLDRKVASLRLTDFSTCEHTMLPIAGCARHAVSEPKPVELVWSAPESRFTGRVRRTGAARRKADPVVSPAIGLIRSVSSVRMANSRVTIARAVHSLPTPNLDLARFPYAEGWGAGLSAASAEVAALGEALQEQATIYRGTEPCVRSSLTDLEGAIHPNASMLFSERQYDRRAAVAASGPASECEPAKEIDPRPMWVLAPFDPLEAVDWCALWNLSKRRWQHLPSTLCWSHYPQTSKEVTCLFDSNGCAAGTSLAEAAEVGLLELVERDAVAIWWYNKLVVPRIDRDNSDAVTEPWFAFLATRGRSAWLLRITNDLAVPTYVACSVLSNTHSGLCVASASRYQDSEARAAALRELAHRILRWDSAPESATRWLSKLDAELPHLAGTHHPSFPADTVDFVQESSLSRLLERLNEHDLDVLVLNQSRAESPFACVKVVVPGLRHYWPRFGPGRLFSSAFIAARGGYKRNEEQLNATSFLM